MAYIFTTISISVVYYCCLLQKNLILRYLEDIMNDWNNIRKIKQFDVLLDYAFLYRKCIFMFIISYNSYVSLMFLLALKPFLLDLMKPLNETRPRTLIIPMNWYNGQEAHFLKILIFQLVISIILGLGVISGLSLYILFLQHTCAMFHITSSLLDNILDVKEKNIKVIDDRIIYKRIINVIKFHKRSIQCIDLFNNIFNVASFIQMICVICFIGIAVISIFDEYKSSSDISSLGLSILYVIFHLIWVFVVFHIGQHLQNISEAAFYKAYETPWYLFSHQSQRLITFMIAQSYKPIYLSIGKMFMASHEHFAWIIRSSISYAMALYSLR
ncbi:uncharacterized protein LOC124950913 [Vespa velutina]|uniref:uncharacterized protein LOC124950913 n=1 Tax=Vespa velutina TaxID=202808 RepID=UPI001FB30DF9|nr:uncharacterized protein LOC124950913 [Vespa velutina]